MEFKPRQGESWRSKKKVTPRSQKPNLLVKANKIRRNTQTLHENSLSNFKDHYLKADQVKKINKDKQV